MAHCVDLFPVCEGAVYANCGVGAAIDQVYPLSLPPRFCFVILSLCALASSGGGAEAPVTEGPASHRTREAESIDAEGTGGKEGEGSTTAKTGGDSSDTDTSSDGSSLVVVDTSVTTPATGTSTTPVPAPASQQPPCELPVPAHPGGWASLSPQAPQALPQLDLLS
ncbi:hypothetical protein NDU88_001393 [Pleurodeles waltl]|uniref:Uncharacterized protein n=1 Tax=Pleurodeles waltl TaxID=8319 RepID=A0AAV7V9J3_PLEWA|nr:hypothetical protein NDU88_001393 [Pleurodeles waltl]